MISAVIFDLDGRPVDSNDLHLQAWQGTFRHFGKEIPVTKLREQIGKGSDQYLPVRFSVTRRICSNDIISRPRRMNHWIGESARGDLNFFTAIAARQTNLSYDQKF